MIVLMIVREMFQKCWDFPARVSVVSSRVSGIWSWSPLITAACATAAGVHCGIIAGKLDHQCMTRPAQPIRAQSWFVWTNERPRLWHVRVTVLCMIVGALTRLLSSVIWSVVIGAAVTTLTPQHQTCSCCWPVFWNIEQKYFVSYKTQNYFTCCRINNISCELLQLWYIVRRRKACWHSWVLDRVLMTLVTLRQWPGSGDHDQVTMQGWDQSPVSGHNAPYSYHHPLSTSSKSNSYHGEPYIPADVFNVSMTSTTADALWSPEFTGQYLTIMM